MTLETMGLICVTAPLVGCFVALVGFRRRHEMAAALVVLSGLLSLSCALLMLFGYDGQASTIVARWFSVGDVELSFGLLLDGKTLIMGAVVALVTTCIQIYSLAYMAHDPGKARFFAFLALFEWSMLSFVLAANLLQMFIFWELVGLASFFLIGFWYEKASTVKAAKKAFLMTRIGDVGLFIGLILLFQATNSLDVLGINALFDPEGLPTSIAPARIELIALLLFVGVIGKSAQFPLHTWLPDAMEGPTPVSALLHSATMVAAGVFLVTRFHGLFLDAPTTMTVMLSIAAFTAVLSSTMAMVAQDMKRVLAFSSISQLGFMLMGLAAGNLFAGYFHLTTHAFFKALLFLCAGSYIHSLGTNDMVAMGRAGARKLRVTSLGLIVGAGALAGIPPLAGFFSKEQIIGSLDGPGQLVFKVAALVAAFMTAYYSFRMIFLLLRPNPSSQAVEEEPAGAQHHGDHEHGSTEPWVMRLPILLLTLGAVGLGFLGERIAGLLGIEHIHHPSLAEMVPAIVIALLGVAAAWFDFGRGRARQRGFVAAVPAVERLFAKRWYLDEIYQRLFVAPALALAALCFGTEKRGFDAAGDEVGKGVLSAGRSVARSHTGRLQFYLSVAVVVISGLALYLSFSSAGVAAR